MNDERLCSHCGYPITERDAVRIYGTHEAHQESQCLELLKATIDRLERERDGLRNALKTNPCCRPVSGASITDGYHYVTVEDCVASGNCGCDCGAALRSPEGQDI